MEVKSPTPSTRMVSVVIPCYNQAHYLGEAIESVRRQTHRHFEIIVVDDGSTDNTVEVASCGGVRCVSHPNQGRTVARNTGLAQATAAYVVFLDADDRLLPAALEIGLRCFEAHPECAFVAGRCVEIDTEGKRLKSSWPPLMREDHYVQLLRENPIWAPAAVMFRTAVVRNAGGFETTLNAAEDYDLYLRIAREHRVFCHDLPVAEYRRHDTNTTRDSKLMLSSTMRVIRSQHRWVKDDPRAEEARLQGIRNWQQRYGEPLVNTIRRQVRAGDWRSATAAIVTLIRYHPTGLLHHASRKLYRVSLGHKPETPDALE
jgi:glycosyltransferase involved in cell wall biosynthesis